MLRVFVLDSIKYVIESVTVIYYSYKQSLY